MYVLRELDLLAEMATADLPVPLARAKSQVGLDHDADDDLVTDKLVGAIEVAEKATNRCVARRRWELVLDEFPVPSIEIPAPPLALDAAVEVAYTDSEGDPQVVADGVFVVDESEPAVLRLASGANWPTRNADTPVRIRFTAGYTAATIPRSLQDGILLELATSYAYREDGVSGTIVSKAPRSAAGLFRRHYVPAVDTEGNG